MLTSQDDNQSEMTDMENSNYLENKQALDYYLKESSIVNLTEN